MGLDIYVIGARIGESIVIRTPAGAFGVIDSYASQPTNPTTNPILVRLSSLGAERLRFLALSHPHMDHFLGLPTIFTTYKGAIDEFWKPPFGHPNWGALFAEFIEEFNAEESEIERERITERIKVFRQILGLAKGEKPKMKSVLTQDAKTLYEETAHELSIECLGPCTDIVDKYQEDLAKKVIVKGLHTSNAAHNLVSSVIAIRYKNWVGLFGGDTEKLSWNEIFDRCKGMGLSKTRFVKVAHHGSPTGSFDRFWDHLKVKNGDAVVTCYAAQNLPNAEGLRPIYEKEFQLHSTNSSLARELTKMRPTASARTPSLSSLRKVPAGGEVHIAVDDAGRVRVRYFGKAGRLLP